MPCECVYNTLAAYGLLVLLVIFLIFQLNRLSRSFERMTAGAPACSSCCPAPQPSPGQSLAPLFRSPA
jgi:hypothetical protein